MSDAYFFSQMTPWERHCALLENLRNETPGWTEDEILTLAQLLGPNNYLLDFTIQDETLLAAATNVTIAITRSTPKRFQFVANSFVDNLPNEHAPFNAEFLFYFLLDGKTCDALVADLEERYKLILKKFGKRKADLWYWKEAIRSTGPVAWAWFKKLLMKPVVAALGVAAAKGLLKDSSVLNFLWECGIL